jgi:drug/metabolite transporter (DMT)-like permease
MSGSMLSPSRRGFAVLALSVLFNGTAFHLMHAAVATLPASMATGISAMSATVAFLTAGQLWRLAGWRWSGLDKITPAALWTCLRRHPLPLLSAPLTGAAGGILMNTAIARYDAETAAFLSTLTLVFLVIGGLLQGDRMRPLEIPVILALVAGAFLFSYQGGVIAYAAIGIMALSTLCTAAKQLLVRRITQREPLPTVIGLNIALITIVCFVIAAAGGNLTMPDQRGLQFAVVSGLCGSFAGMALLYSAYNIIGVARGAPLDAMRPLVVLLIGLALGTPLPAPLRLLGAAIILAGAATLPIIHRRR